VKIEREIVIHISDEARAEWEKNKHDGNPPAASCPSCEIAEMKKLKRKEPPPADNEKDYITGE
jgi:hypothetical protein